ncbi:MAG: N-acetyltransferase family protein [Tagaea sp.]|nr:N-acetyltransferase family protein [Tagaea sp.]
MIVRPSRETDAAAIAAIYDHYVVRSTATMELTPPGVAEIAKRRRDILDKGLSHLVAEADGEILGFAYASFYRPRPGYRFALEDTVYVKPDSVRKGIGRALLTALIAACEAAGARQLVAVIGDDANVATIGLHAALGFRIAGRLASVGFKFDRWTDQVLMQRALAPGDAALAERRMRAEGQGG